ncbi:MAG: hypothetical protein VX640_14850 [Pseudomonadota bacterium]|nr:hypothetical protein [Pseudomonadota bacterium]
MTATGQKAALAVAPSGELPIDEVPFRGASPAQTAGYIEELVGELERLAAGPSLERLRDLLKLAKQEARRQVIEQAG